LITDEKHSNHDKIFATHKACRPYVSLHTPLSRKDNSMSDSNFTVKFCPKCKADTERTKKGECKPCAKLYHHAWYIDNYEKVNSDARAWQLENPDKVKVNVSKWSSSNPEKVKKYNTEFKSKNQEKVNASSAEWRSANPEKYKTSIALSKAKNPEKYKALKLLSTQNRRAKKREVGGKLSKELVGKLFKLQKGKCACCSQQLGDDYHLDHIMPLALGGQNTDVNIQLLKSRCNMQKNSKHPVDFMQQRGFLL